MTNAFDYVKSAPGLETLEDYPYTGFNGQCKFDPTKAVAQVSGYFNVSKNETLMVQVTYETGPLSVAVNALSW